MAGAPARATASLTPCTWYLVGAGMIISAIAIVGISYGQYTKTVGGMQRVVMPGRVDITLPIGPSTLYAESRSIVEGTPYEPPADLRFECGIEPAAGITFKRSTASVSYSYGDFAGHNAFEVSVPKPGTYTLSCEAAQPFVMGIGRGVGAWTVIALVGTVPAFGGLVVILLVMLKRRKQLRRAARSQSAAAS